MQDKKYTTNLNEYIASRASEEANRKNGFWSGVNRGVKSLGQQFGNSAETFANLTGLGLEATNSTVGLAEGGLVALVYEATGMVMSPRSFRKSESSAWIADAIMRKTIQNMDEEERAKAIFVDLGE